MRTPIPSHRLLHLALDPERAALVHAWLRSVALVEAAPLDAVHTGMTPAFESFDAVGIDWSADHACAIGRVRSAIRPRRMPIVMLTDGSEAQRVAAFALGADHVEPFPPNPASIEATLSRWRTLMPDPYLEAAATLPDPASGDGAPGMASPSEIGSADPTVPVAAVILPAPRLSLDARSYACLIDGQRIELPHLLFELLRYLVQQDGACCDREHLLDHVWGGTYIPGSNVVDTAVKRLRRALRPYGLDHCITTVRRGGYRFAPETLPPGAHVAP